MALKLLSPHPAEIRHTVREEQPPHGADERNPQRMDSPTSSPAAVAVAPSPNPLAPAASIRRGPRARFLLVAVLATAGLLWLSYFPVNCGWLAWFALVPLLVLVRATARPRIVYLSAWIGGLAFYFPALQWMRVADPRMYYTWIGLAIYCSLYFPLTLLIVRFLDRRTRLPLALTLPVVWTALEFFRSWFATGFSWYLVGYTQHDFLPVLQIADLAGVYGVTFLVVAVNAVLFEALYRWGGFRTRFAGPDAPPSRSQVEVVIEAGVVAAALLAAVGYGEWRLGQDAFTPGPRIALIQGNVPQQIRNDSIMIELMESHYVALCDLAAQQEPKPALLVWPETSFPYSWSDTAADAPRPAPAGWDGEVQMCRFGLTEIARRWGTTRRRVAPHTNILVGLDSGVFEADGRKHAYNSALLLDVDATALPAFGASTAALLASPSGPGPLLAGSAMFPGRARRRRAGPLRQDPLRAVRGVRAIPRLAAVDAGFRAYDFDYSIEPGRGATHFPLKVGPDSRFSFGVAICYEDTDADRTRPYGGGDGKPPVDFLLNISNDGWFDGTSEHDEHLAICRFRAVECRRSIGRAVNMGVSAVIDPDGRVLAPRPVEGTEWDRPEVRTTIGTPLAGLSSDDLKTALELFPSEHDHRAAVWLASPGDTLPAARWAEFKKTACILLADVPIDHRVSFYALWGDWLVWGCWALLGGGVVLALAKKRRRT